MANVPAIRAGLAANLSTVLDWQASAYTLTNPTPPSAHVVMGPAEYDLAMGRGLDELTFRVQVFVGYVADIGAQALLDEYLDDSNVRCVKHALEIDRTLGGSCFDAHVTARTGQQQLTREGGGDVLMAEWTVLVRARGA